MRSLTSKMYMLHQPNVNQTLLYEAVAILAQDNINVVGIEACSDR